MNHYPLYRDGQLHPQADELLTKLAGAPGAPLSALSLDEARANFLEPSWIGPPGEVAGIDNLTIPGASRRLTLRRYTPRGNPPFPVLVFFHGGGFVLGSAPEFDGVCTRLSAGAACMVLSLEYGVAPENPYPVAVEEAATALRWVGGHAPAIGGDPARLAVAGDSAGGNLAALVSIRARDERFPAVAQQVLICPWVDLSSTEDESFRWFGEGPWLSTASIRWYRDHYLTRPDLAALPTVSPLLAPDLSGLAPALVLNAEFDVLRDQVARYARRLAAEGTPVQYRSYPGTLHDFAVLPGLFDQADDALRDVCTALRRSFAS